jgi:hypothetical protein
VTGAPKISFLYWTLGFLTVICVIPILIGLRIIPGWWSIPAVGVYIIWLYCSRKMVDKGWFRK